MTDRTPGRLVCVYYRVGPADLKRVISSVREFQRTLADTGAVREAQVLLRCELPRQAPPAPLPDALPAPRHDPDSPPADAPVDPGADATVMETYRLAPAPDDAALRALLDTLETAFAPLAGALRGARHVELFAPCVS